MRAIFPSIVAEEKIGIAARMEAFGLAHPTIYVHCGRIYLAGCPQSSDDSRLAVLSSEVYIWDAAVLPFPIVTWYFGIINTLLGHS